MKEKPNESSDEDEVTFTDIECQSFKVKAYYVILDRLRSCLSKRTDAYKEV